MRKYFVIAFFFFVTTLSAQDWQHEADRTCSSLIKNFWGASFPGAATQKYFNAYGAQTSMKNEWWWQAHAMDVVVDAYVRTGHQRYLQMYEPWYEGLQGSNYEDFADDPLHNNSIDDMEWLCISMIRMYETCGEKKYFNHARRLYDHYIITTWGPADEAPWHGGISWSTDEKIPKTKNACSNGPGGIIAYMIARNLPEAEGEKYLADLHRIYNWERAHLFDTTTGAVADHMNRQGEVRPEYYSYNPATFIAMARELYQQTHQPSYLADAILAADFTISHFAHGQKQLMSLTSAQHWGGDRGLFHGIFFRYLAELLQAHILPLDKQQEYEHYLAACGQLALQCLQPSIDIFSRDWEQIIITDPATAPLTPHVTGATLMAMLARM